MEHTVSPPEPSTAFNSVMPNPSAGMMPEGGQINLKDFGLFTCIKLVLTATTPLVGGLSLSKKEQIFSGSAWKIKDESDRIIDTNTGVR